MGRQGVGVQLCGLRRLRDRHPADDPVRRAQRLRDRLALPGAYRGRGVDRGGACGGRRARAPRLDGDRLVARLYELRRALLHRRSTGRLPVPLGRRLDRLLSALVHRHGAARAPSRAARRRGAVARRAHGRGRRRGPGRSHPARGRAPHRGGLPGGGGDQPRVPRRRRPTPLGRVRRLLAHRVEDRATLADPQSRRPRDDGRGRHLPVPGRLVPGRLEARHPLAGVVAADRSCCLRPGTRRAEPADRGAPPAGRPVGVRAGRDRDPRVRPLRRREPRRGRPRDPDAAARRRQARVHVPRERPAVRAHPPRIHDRCAHRAREPAQARHRSRAAPRGQTDARDPADDLRPRRLQGVQRQLRPSGRGRAARPPRREAGGGARRAGQLVSPRRGRVLPGGARRPRRDRAADRPGLRARWPSGARASTSGARSVRSCCRTRRAT